MKRLSEARIIELATMIQFMEEDEGYLEKLENEAGIGYDGDYEKFNLSMGKYWLNGAKHYLERIVDSWLAEDHKKTAELADVPVTVVLNDRVVTYKDEKETTTWVDRATGEIGTASIDSPSYGKGKQLDIYHGATPKEKPAWTPAYKDSDKIKQTINEILNDTPAKEWTRPGFQGWLAASATGVLGGKSEPALMLTKVKDVLEKRMEELSG